MPRIVPDEPIDRIDPADPMDRMDPDEPMDKIDPADPMDRALPTLNALRKLNADANDLRDRKLICRCYHGLA